MHLRERLHQRDDLIKQLFRRNRMVVEDCAEIRTVQVFHDDIDGIIVFKEIIHINDPRDVFQLAEHLRFLKHFFFSFG